MGSFAGIAISEQGGECCLHRQWIGGAGCLVQSFGDRIASWFPDQELFVRNMGKPGDTPGFRPHASRGSQWAFPGAEKFHPNHQHHEGIGFFPTPDQWLTHLKADTVVAFFGYNESFDGRQDFQILKQSLRPG